MKEVGENLQDCLTLQSKHPSKSLAAPSGVTFLSLVPSSTTGGKAR